MHGSVAHQHGISSSWAPVLLVFYLSVTSPPACSNPMVASATLKFMTSTIALLKATSDLANTNPMSLISPFETYLWCDMTLSDCRMRSSMAKVTSFFALYRRWILSANSSLKRKSVHATTRNRVTACAPEVSRTMTWQVHGSRSKASVAWPCSHAYVLF
jgi:hypothetical protein